MDADDEDPDLGGGGPKVIGVVLSGGCSGGVAFRGRDVGPDTPEGAGPEYLPTQGRATAHREEAGAEEGGDMGISSAGGRNGGGRILGDRSQRYIIVRVTIYFTIILCLLVRYTPIS